MALAFTHLVSLGEVTTVQTYVTRCKEIVVVKFSVCGVASIKMYYKLKTNLQTYKIL